MSFWSKNPGKKYAQCYQNLPRYSLKSSCITSFYPFWLICTPEEALLYKSLPQNFFLLPRSIFMAKRSSKIDFQIFKIYTFIFKMRYFGMYFINSKTMTNFSSNIPHLQDDVGLTSLSQKSVIQEPIIEGLVSSNFGKN